MAASEGAIPRPDSENALRSHVSNDQRRHVGVVGAGVSGLCYTDILLSHGSEVTILEICQSDHPGYIVNIGPKISEAANRQDSGSSISRDEFLYDYVRKRVGDAAVSDGEEELLTQMSEIWEETFVESNYSTIVDRISKPTRERTEILLRSEVTSVHTPERSRYDNAVGLVAEAFSLFRAASYPKTRIRDQQPEVVSIREDLRHVSLDLRPSYAEDTNPAQWPQEVWNLASFAAPNKHPTLLFYLYGDCSRYIVNSVYGKTREEKQRFLQAFLYPYYSRLPGFNAGKEACHPEAILATEWLKDDFSGNGSYCNFQVGVEEADKDVLAFRHGCPERRLWFFREHAAPFEECGTVAGAYLSGESATQMIVAMYDDSLGKRKPEAITTSVEHDQ
ncbi:FAD/NAD(P)-binding domain-containing protein [Xylaria arbuscula]|nr:FAD/NAD(P)-binding domain-containing protein [Xylaria arbuscula]